MKLKIATYNTHLDMPLRKYNDVQRSINIANSPSLNKCDIVGFSEAWSDDAKRAICEKFEYKYFYETFGTKMGSGLALASKYPIFDTAMIAFNQLAFEDKLSAKGYIRAIVNTPFGDFRLYLTHTQADAETDPTSKKSESRRIRKENLNQIINDTLRYQVHLPVIVIGDLNVPGEKPEYDSLQDQPYGTFITMTDAYRNLHPDTGKMPGYTYDAKNPMVKHWDDGYKGGERLDYILYRGDGTDWSVDECFVDSKVEESDHYPLVATLDLRRSARYDFPKNEDDAVNQAKIIKKKYGRGSSTLIAITNETEEDLSLVDFHSWDGSFFSQPPPYLPAGRSIGILHVHPDGEAIGSMGCIVLRQGISDFFLGFDTPHSLFFTNKIFVETKSMHHWWLGSKKEQMKEYIEDSKYSSSASRINRDNIKFTISGTTQKGDSPEARFTIKGDDRPIPELEIIGGTFTYDGQEHPVRVKEPNVEGKIDIGYEPGGIPANAGIYTVTVWFESKDKNYRNVTKQTKITILKAKPKINWANPVDLVQSTSLGTARLNATVTTEIGSVKGKLSYFWYDMPITPGVKLPAGLHTLSVRFEPEDSNNFEVAKGSVQLRIWVAEKVLKDGVTFSNLSLKYYGHATPHYWQWIIDANKGNIPDDYRRTLPGTKIFIPEKPPASNTKKANKVLSLLQGGRQAVVTTSSLEVREVPDENVKNLRYLKKGDKLMVTAVWVNEAGDRWGQLAENEWSAMVFDGRSFMVIDEE